MTKGQILFLPAYWWYSIEFGKETSVSTFKYKTYMNTIAILPKIIMKLLQNQNVRHNTVERVTANKTLEPPRDNKTQESINEQDKTTSL